MMNNFIKRAAEFFSGAEGEQLDKPKEPWYPTPDGKPIRDHESIQAKGLPPINNWAHPLKDKNNPLLQLTQMANAAAGSYPLGVGGLWHGGVHFDSGTGVSDEAGVHCLADGEVVAYRVDSQALMTTYQVNRLQVKKPFSRNFVLVRHVLQAPKIEGISTTPPRLIFYSLYMHLQNWDVYQKTQSLTRPAFWPEGETYVVPETAADKYPGPSQDFGLNIRHQSRQGKVLDLLPRGTEITISGEGGYRKLENTPGPRYLQNPNAQGSLLGYVRFDQLKAIGNGEHVVEKDLDVHTETNARSETIGPKLPTGSQVTVSGEGDFRKLERVNQYVHFKSLQPTREPLKLDDITLIDEHLPIKAGELIGHLGEYQDYAADRPEKKLHLEVFSEDDVDKFIKDCREWALKLPAASKTWLKLVKGTVVAAHQDHFSATKLPTFNATDAVSGTDLLVPKSLLDNLRATEKITVPATEGRKAYNWYRLDLLLNDANNHLLSGWVREEVGVTPWVSPWEWEGYDILTDYTTSPAFMASFLRSYRRFSDEQLQRYGPLADAGDTGPIKKRLHDIIDRNRDNKITAEEIQAAMRIPAHAQSISQLIIRYESEWHYKPHKWDGLDEMFGHGGSTPHLNWMAEKERIKQISWWGAVADKVGLPSDGKVYHLHPVGMVGYFIRASGLIDVQHFLDIYEKEHVFFRPQTAALTIESKENLRKILLAVNSYYESTQEKSNVYEAAYMLATARHETFYYPASEYFSEKPEVGGRSYFNKYDPVLASTAKLRAIAIQNGNTSEGDGYKYRGRGCVHLTWKINYQKFSNLLSIDFVSHPEAAAQFENAVPIMIKGMKKGIFTGKKLADYINTNGVDYLSSRRVINGLDESALIASYADRFESILKRTSLLSTEF